MNITNFSDYILFLIIFLPGFISLKVYDLIVPSVPRDFSKSFFEVIAYTAFNYGIFFWPITHGYTLLLENNINAIFYLVVTLVILIGPIIWPVILVYILRNSALKKYVIDSRAKPWDYVFDKRESYWIIVHLLNGEMIAGIYDEHSFTSSFPAEEQIYLEEVWKIDKLKTFIKPVAKSRGIIIFNNAIASVELFK